MALAGDVPPSADPTAPTLVARLWRAYLGKRGVAVAVAALIYPVVMYVFW